jgi:hypothetical protein
LPGLVLALQVFHGGPSALAPLGGLFALAKLARLFKVATAADLRENPVLLDGLLEALESALKGLSLVNIDTRHANPPFLLRIASLDAEHVPN